MPNRVLDKSRARFHRLFPEETRAQMYFRSPQVVKRLWDRLGNAAVGKKLFRKISEKDVLFSVRFFWFHDPSTELVHRWYAHALRFNFNLNGLVHELQHSREAVEHEPLLQNSPVPVDLEYVDYAYRLLLRREPTKQERNAWHQKLKERKWSFEQFVSSFENSTEYQKRLRVEAAPHLVKLRQFKIYVRLGDYFTSAPIAVRRVYEPHISHLIEKIVHPGDYVVDVGANVGYHALTMAAIVGERGKVFAFEPHPGNNELIELSVEANHFTNLELFPYAAGDEAGEIELLVEGNHTNARINSNPELANPTATRYPVRVVKIDECLGDIPRLRFVKIDVEGAEPMAIAGMSRLITDHKPILLFEFFPNFIRLTSQSDPEQFLDQIIAYGYRLHVIGATPLLSEVSAPSEVMFSLKESGHTLVDILALPANFDESTIA